MSHPDALAAYANALIRAHNGDDLDPFIVQGHPRWGAGPKAIVASCFYYAIVSTPKVTILFDNDGRGGMCDLSVEEVQAAWATRDLLDAIGTSFDDLHDGRILAGSIPVLPSPDAELLDGIVALLKRGQVEREGDAGAPDGISTHP